MAAMHIGNPFTSGTRIIAIQHGGNGINTQPVNTISLHPEQRVTRQKIAHFGAAKIVNERAPVAMKSFAGIGIFIQRRAVELRQAVRIRGEMCRHPINEHTKSKLVTSGNKTFKAFRWAKARGECVETERLITPGTIERMFADGH